MISEGSSDTVDWSNSNTEINDILYKCINREKWFKIIIIFYCIFD